MFHQPVTPVADSLLGSFAVAAVPIAAVLILLGVFRRPAWQAALAGLLVALCIAVGFWKMPLPLALNSAAAGATFAVWPVMWVAFNGLVLYNVAVISRHFDAFRSWVIAHLPNDRRIVLVVIGFCFGALLEGIAGFGTPVAITSALLILLGFDALEAVSFTLIFNTAPVAFGALGVPITTLGAVTQISDVTLGAMVGRQLPFIAVLLPFYVVSIYGGLRALRGVWPALAIAGGAFAIAQFVASNFLGYVLTDVFSSLTSLLITVGFVKVWRMPHDPAFALKVESAKTLAPDVAPWRGWIPWAAVSAVVITWTTLGINHIGEVKIPWPGLNNAVYITLYDKPYAAVWTFQPFATGTAILLATVLTTAFVGIGLKGFFRAVRDTFYQIRIAALTTALIVGLAYLMNYAGMAYTLGDGIASAGAFFPLLSAFLGWIAVFLSGSDTSGNALFGNLQVVAARHLNLSPILMAATNSSGGVMGKMISPQNIATGVSTVGLKGSEGLVLARTFKHSIILTLLLGLIAMLQQYVFPWTIPN